MKTSVIISACHAPEQTQACIESIRKYTAENQYEIILVTPVSTADVTIYQGQPDINVITSKENRGCYHSYNQAVRVATGDNILFLENNVVVTQNGLSNLKCCLYSSQGIGAVGPVVNDCAYSQELPLAANQANPDLWEETLSLPGFCLLIKRQMIEETGLFDEEFSPGAFGDNDYSFRIRLAGYQLFLCKDTLFQRYNCTPSGGDLQLDRNKFTAKWDFDLPYSTFIRHDLISFIDKPKDAPLKVLEIGCACGRTLLQIKNMYKKAEVYGIEYSDKPAAIAASIADIIAGDIEKAVFPYPQAFFDYIILGDVLEHLINPWQVLEKLQPYLKPDGYILASIPNVMHFSVIRSLIQGNWTYENAGLLDKTHLRFFTLSEIDKLFKNAGYKVDGCQPILIYETENDRHFMRTLADIAGVSQLVEQYRAYQYLLKASKIAVSVPLSPQPAMDLQQLVFLLRRIEQKIEPTTNVTALLDYITAYPVTPIQMLKAIRQGIINKDHFIVTVAIACYNNGLTAYGHDLLVEACKASPQSPGARHLLRTLDHLKHNAGQINLGGSQ